MSSSHHVNLPTHQGLHVDKHRGCWKWSWGRLHLTALLAVGAPILSYPILGCGCTPLLVMWHATFLVAPPSRTQTWLSLACRLCDQHPAVPTSYTMQLQLVYVSKHSRRLPGQCAAVHQSREECSSITA
jgi:hypothetical protein